MGRLGRRVPPVMLAAIAILLGAGVAVAAPPQNGVLVVPFQSDVHQGPDDVFLGVAAAHVLDHVLALHSGAKECWGYWHTHKLFAGRADFDAWLAGRGDVSAGVAKVGLRWVVTGRVVEAGAGLHVRMTLRDRAGGKEVQRELGLDAPGLVGYREGFLRMLADAGIPAPASQRPAMSWRENLPRGALAILGRGMAAYYWAYGGAHPTWDANPFETALREAPASYVLLDDLGYVSLQRKDYAAARHWFARALAVNASGYDSASGMMDCCLADGSEQAVHWAERCCAIAKRGRRYVAYALYRLGRRAYEGSDFAQAAQYWERDLPVLRAMQDRKGEKTTLGNLATAWEHLSQFDQAAQCYRQALTIQRELKDRAGEGDTLNNLGIAYDDLSRYDQAMEVLQQALAIERELKDRAAEGTTLGNLGNAYNHLSQYDQAIAAYQQALAIERELKDRAGEAPTLSNLGIAYGCLSRYDEAIACLQQALAIEREVKDRAGEGTTLNSLGVAYSSLDRYDQAIAFYQRALAIKRELKDRAREAPTLSNLGGAYDRLGRYDQAIEYYRQALAIVREVKDRAGEGEVLNSLGYVYDDLGRYDEAVGYYQQALAIRREVKNRAGEAVTLSNLGVACENLGQYDPAMRYYQQAVALAREVKNRAGEGTTLGLLMSLSRHLAHPRLAIFYGKLAVNAWQEIRGHLQGLDKASRKSFLHDKEGDYHTLADLLIDQGRFLEAEQVIGLLKDAEFRKFTRGSSGDPSHAVAFTPLEQKYHRDYEAISGGLVALGTEYDALDRLPSRTPDQERRLAKLDQTLQADRAELERFLKLLDSELGSSTAVGTREDAIRSASDVQATLKDLGPGIAVVYVLVSPDHVREVLVTSSIYKPYEVDVKQADLFRKVADFRRVLQNPGLDPRPAARAMYDVLLPAALRRDVTEIHPTTVMWWLDNRLRYIPINALYDGQKYLVERWRNTVFTRETARKLELPPVPSWRVAGLGVSRAWPGFVALPGVPEELKDVVHAPGDPPDSGDLPGTRALDQAFTSDALRAALLDRTPVIHLASHFNFSPGDDTQSFLLLGTGQKLSLDEIKTWRFSGVDLLTLSACDTASGTVDADGHELESFAMLAQRAGARAVIATLWPVADASTPALMREFYRLRAQHPTMSKIDALQQAQIALLHGTLAVAGPPAQRGMQSQEGPGEASDAPFQPDPGARYSHPYYWAPFILMGDWK